MFLYIDVLVARRPMVEKVASRHPQRHDQGQKAVAVRLTSNTVAEGRAATKLVQNAATVSRASRMTGRLGGPADKVEGAAVAAIASMYLWNAVRRAPIRASRANGRDLHNARA
jgi:hypothetical protein